MSFHGVLDAVLFLLFSNCLSLNYFPLFISKQIEICIIFLLKICNSSFPFICPFEAKSQTITFSDVKLLAGFLHITSSLNAKL